MAYKFGPDSPVVYALEGSVAVAGMALKWLKDNLNLLSFIEEAETLAKKVMTTGDVYFVPAFSGLYAPYWRKDARGYVKFKNPQHLKKLISELFVASRNLRERST